MPLLKPDPTFYPSPKMAMQSPPEKLAYVANSDFHKPKHLYSWKTLVRCEKNWPAVKQALRANVDIALTLFRNGSWAAA